MGIYNWSVCDPHPLVWFKKFYELSCIFLACPVPTNWFYCPILSIKKEKCAQYNRNTFLHWEVFILTFYTLFINISWYFSLSSIYIIHNSHQYEGQDFWSEVWNFTKIKSFTIFRLRSYRVHKSNSNRKSFKIKSFPK